MLTKFALMGLLLLALLSPTRAHAQGLETLGSRAAALSAFVAVADDASAMAWNPSGLVTGPIFNAVFDFGRSSELPDDPPVRGASGGALRTTLIAVGTSPVGFGYYRLVTYAAASPAVGSTPGRQGQEEEVVVRTISTTHLGGTVQQSIGRFLTLGATVKLVRGGVGRAIRSLSTWEQAIDLAESLETRGSSRGDLDIGAMVAAGPVRAGVVVRNVTEPTFGEEGTAFSATLPRHVRVGLAWGNQWPGISATVVAFDADVTRVPHPAGERRDIAVGVEQWVQRRLIGVRGGLRASTVDDARPVLSAGASFAVRPGTYVDAYVARGTRDGHGWGIAARMTY
jgi:hypothetical protein